MTTQKNKPVIVHKDKLGRVLAVDNYVAYPASNQLRFGRIRKINPKMIGLVGVSPGFSGEGTLKYPGDLLLLEDRDMTWYLLKNSQTR